MLKIEKDDIQKAQGLKNFLIPVEVLPVNVEMSGLRSIHKLSVVGTTVIIEGQKYLKVDNWKILR